MQVGFVGLGRMGANMALRLMQRDRHVVVGYDAVPAVAKTLESEGASAVASLDELVATLKPPRVIWIMVPAGDAVEQTVLRLTDLCEAGDLLIDGGNSHYKDSMRRARHVAVHGIELLDVGTSGGIWGRELGYSLMIGGSAEGFARAEPLARTLAPEHGYAHVGPSGAGHFCKMVHNGVEYALMQAYAEGFSLLEHGPFDYDLHRVAELWNHGGVIRSWLLELTAEMLEQDPTLADVAGYVEDTGEGRWTVEAAVEHAVPAPVITQSLFARFRSREADDFGDKIVAMLRKQFGGHAVRRTGTRRV
ncbi:MAG TPA: decarboxylating 6-phosphogluconate dehydrogenase [Chloroflexota bacterium]|nr:decarboxylating 6-phosphogluconate dehydrogenase [Chloroflexota bacterium]